MQPKKTPASARLSAVFAALLMLSLVVSACAPSSSGAPAAPGQYDVQKSSVRYDGDRYELFWVDKDGSMQRMETRNLRMVRDEQRTYLEMPGGGADPILHLREDEPVAIDGQDNQGGFSSFWFPFLLGNALGGGLGGGRGPVIINNPAPGETRSWDAGSPAYRYPPTESFGRGDQLHGSVDSSKAQTPDYKKVQPAPFAVAGQGGGSGGGNAATNKAPGTTSPSSPDSAVVPNASASSAQAGGSGSGTAATAKGGFKSGSQSFASKTAPGVGTGAGSRGLLGKGSNASSSSSSGARSSGGVKTSPSKGLGGARIGGKR